ncbi:MAG: glutathione S-transferase family protein [Rhizobiaceae bacterium]
MLALYHHPLLASCRFVRLILGEYGEEPELVEEKPWERRREFLALNPAGSMPVLVAEGGTPICGFSVIAEYLDETRGAMMRDRRLLADDPMERAEIRRLVDWYLVKTENDVTRYLVRERAFKQVMPGSLGGGAPDSAVLRAARANVRQHLKYTAWLANRSNWLAGDRLSYADMAAGAALSCLDYLGEIDWSAYPVAREWYQRLKSRPSFRPILADRVRGLPPVSHYPDLDF